MVMRSLGKRAPGSPAERTIALAHVRLRRKEPKHNQRDMAAQIRWRRICVLRRRIAGAAMPILTIRHVTTYHYRQPVAFGEHRMMLRPRDDGDQTVLESALDITPAPSHLAWTRDSFGNQVATARFADPAAGLRFESTISIDHAPVCFRADDIADFARSSLLQAQKRQVLACPVLDRNGARRAIRS
jgi:hypothetical protein